MDPISSLAMATGLSWASGLRLYATVLAVGLLAKFQLIHLPDGLAVLSHPWVLATAGFLTVVEFLADKIPLVDSLWDSVHTFIRIPAGAALAVGAIGADNAAATTVIALLGGTLAGATHATKATTRALINTSPEPVSNVVASVAEDGLWFTGGLLALLFPFVFMVGIVLFLLSLLYVVPKLIKRIRGKRASKVVV